MEGKYPFDPARPCPKCGFTDVGIGYCGPGQRRSGCYYDSEHMHRFCRRCRYEWFERPLDQEAAQ